MKLSRRTLEAALARFRSGWWDREHEETIEAACDALLAVMEPASDEEVWQVAREHADGLAAFARKFAVTVKPSASDQAVGHFQGYRAAEARARRLAEWETE